MYLVMIQLPEKNPKKQGGRGRGEGGGEGTYFFENLPGFFWFFILPLEILDKTKLHPPRNSKNLVTLGNFKA